MKMMRMDAPAGARVVASGCDSLYYTVPGLLPRAVLDALASERERAIGGEDVMRVLDGFPFAVTSHGGEGGYRFCLVCEDVSGAPLYTVLVTDVDNGAPVKVQLHSYALWFGGAWRSYRESVAAVAALYGVDAQKLGGRISRLDLCADFQGWDLSGGIDTARIVSRCRGVRAYATYDDVGARRLSPSERRRVRSVGGFVEPVKTYKARRVGFGAGPAREVFTGWDWGSGKKIMLRIYNKTFEIKSKSKKYWFEKVWAKSGNYLAGADVWRLEIQVRREAFNDMRLGDEKQDRVNTVEDALNQTESIWRYVVGGMNPICSAKRDG